METKKFEILTAKSNIDWTGRKVTGAHNGTIAIKAGNLILDNGQLTAGNFVIDTTSIKILDVTDPETNAQFAGHLFSEDFFATDSYPEPVFTIISADHISNEKYLIAGNLTIKGITHPVSFAADVVTADDTVTASGKIVIDRTKYDMKFRSGNFFTNLGDTLIYNEIDLDVKIAAAAAL
jgi:polyisoprenoid-binding protein YceI